MTVFVNSFEPPDFATAMVRVGALLGYVGAMGSRRTHHDRLTKLRNAGLTNTELTHLASPIGLHIGARTPEETAISIAAEIINTRWGGTGKPLTQLTGPIHT